MTTPEGSNIINYGANAKPLLEELKKIARAMVESGDATEQQARRMVSALTSVERAKISLDRLASRPVVQEVPKYGQLVEQLKAATLQADKLFNTLERIKNAPNVSANPPIGPVPRVGGGAAFGAPGFGGGGPQFTPPPEILAAMRAQNAATVQQSRVVVDSARRTELLARREARIREELIASLSQQHDAAERARVADFYRAQIAQAGNGGGRGSGFGGDVKSGFFGGDHTGIGRSVGQAARFGLVYGAMYRILSGVEQTFTKSLQEAIEFQKSLTELSLATDQTRQEAQNLADGLSQEANKYGFSGSAGVRTGTRALGVFRQLDSTGVAQGATARVASQSILQQAFLSGRDTDQLTQNVAAISQAFELGAESIGRITDTTTFFEKQFGIAVGDLSDSLPAIASLARQSGFSIEETAGLAAAVQSRQAGTPASASGLLSQILTREGEGTVQAIFDELQITGETFRDKFAALAQILPDLSEQQRGRVAATFGRGRSQSAAIGLLEELPRIFSLADRRAQGEGDGLTARQAQQRLNDIGGILTTLGGALNGLYKEIGQSGLLDAVGGLAIGFRELVEVTTNILRVWNQVPSVVQDAVIAIGLLALANRAGAGGAVASRFVSGLATRGGFAGPVPVGAADAARRVGARGTGAAALGALGLTPGIAAGLGGALAIGLIKGSFDSVAKSAQAAADTLNVVAGTDLSSFEGVTSGINSLNQASEDRRKNASFFADRLFGNLTGAADSRTRDLSTISGEKDLLQKIANALKETAKGPQDVRAGGGFGDLSLTSVGDGLDKLTKRGFSAAEQLDLLTRSLDDTTRSAADAAAIFNQQLEAQKTAAGVRGLLTGLDFGGDTRFPLPDRNGLAALNPFGNTDGGILGNIKETLGQAKNGNTASFDDIVKGLGDLIPDAQSRESFFASAFQKALEDGKITTEESGQIAKDFTNLFNTDDLAKKFGPSNVQAVLAAFQLSLAKSLGLTTVNTRPDSADGGVTELSQTYQKRASLLELSNQKIAAVRPGDNGGLQSAIRERIKLIKQIIADTPAADSTASSLVDLADIQKQLRDAVNFPLQLAAAKGSAKAAGTADTGDDLKAALQQAQANLSLARANRKDDPIAFQNALGAVGAAKLRIAEDEKQQATALRDLLGAQVGSQLANAISAVRDAQKALDVAETASERNAAQIQLLEAERNARSARRGAGSTRRRLGLDRTNPAQIAAEEARLAQQELAQEKAFFKTSGSAGGSRITAVERQRLQELTLGSQDASLNAQQTQFQQNLSAAQRAQQLGTLSNSAYLDYLKSQESAIEAQLAGMDSTTNGYKQLHDNLDQLKETEKAFAEGLNSQFNLGDISLPTPFEARRYAQSLVAGPGSFVGGGGGSVVNSNNTITLSGLTSDEMEAVLNAAFGNGNTQTGAGY